jgi:hypothetical protein
MSDLQQLAKPFLVPLIEGQPITLSRHAQKIVSAWVTMTTMTSEFVDDDFVAVPQEQRNFLRLKQRTPPGWRIWIGRYRWEPGVERWTHHVMCLAEKGYKGPAGDTSYPANTQTNLMCVGNNFFFLAMSSSVDSGQDVIRRTSFPIRVKEAARQVFPAAAEKVFWPPSRVLNKRDLSVLANGFASRVERVLREQRAQNVSS